MSFFDPRELNHDEYGPTFDGRMKLVTGHCSRSNSAAASVGRSDPSSAVKKTTLSVVLILYRSLACGSSVALRGVICDVGEMANTQQPIRK